MSCSHDYHIYWNHPSRVCEPAQTEIGACASSESHLRMYKSNAVTHVLQLSRSAQSVFVNCCPAHTTGDESGSRVRPQLVVRVVNLSSCRVNPRQLSLSGTNRPPCSNSVHLPPRPLGAFLAPSPDPVHAVTQIGKNLRWCRFGTPGVHVTAIHPGHSKEKSTQQPSTQSPHGRLQM